MTVPQRHITAGDISPVTIKTESTYGSPTGTAVLYGDIAEGGNITIKSTPNPYISWRYGSRSFNASNYVTQQKDAAFSASLEVRDKSGWEKIIEYATGSGGTSGDPLLASRSEEFYIKTGASAWSGYVFYGCKTDKLTISADAPGGIVKFEEDVLASTGAAYNINTAIGAWSDNTPAVQWLSGMTIGSTEIYPQSFKLSITNNLERVRTASIVTTKTEGLLEGRREIELEADIWMVDLQRIVDSINNNSVSNIVLTLGSTAEVSLTLSGVKYMCDGNNTPLIQDKQRQTLRFRATDIAVTTVA